MENRAPIFLTRLFRKKPQIDELSEVKGWVDTADDTRFNCWGSSPGSTSSGPKNDYNGWYKKPKDECNGWGLGSGSGSESEPIDVGSFPKDEYNGWGLGLGSESKPIDVGSFPNDEYNGWGSRSGSGSESKPIDVGSFPKDEYNGWGSGLGSESESIDVGSDSHPNAESRPVQVKSWAPALVPSAPPLPDEGFNEDPVANVSDHSYYQSAQKDVVSINGGENGESWCVVCWEGPIEGACVPCGHMASCMRCLHEIESKQGTCPVCRAKIDKVMRIYAVSTK